MRMQTVANYEACLFWDHGETPKTILQVRIYATFMWWYEGVFPATIFMWLYSAWMYWETNSLTTFVYVYFATVAEAIWLVALFTRMMVLARHNRRAYSSR